MVKVITIMDDVYAELYRLKRAKGMSFSEVLRFMLGEREKESRNMMAFAGCLSSGDIDHKALHNMRRMMHSLDRRR